MTDRKEKAVMDDQLNWTILTRLVKLLELDDILKPEDIAEWSKLSSRGNSVTVHDLNNEVTTD